MRPRAAAAIGIVVAMAAYASWGCSSTRSSDWTNHNISEVVREFGQPALVLPFAEQSGPYSVLPSPDASLYVWYQTKTGIYSTRNASNSEGGFDTTTACQIWRFSVDSSGTIRNYTAQQLPWVCPAGPKAR